MKEKKPFKVGAKYKLKKACVAQFQYDRTILRHFGLGANGGVFEFVVGHIDNNGRAYVEQNGVCVAHASERRMFTRVDNK